MRARLLGVMMGMSMVVGSSMYGYAAGRMKDVPDKKARMESEEKAEDSAVPLKVKKNDEGKEPLAVIETTMGTIKFKFYREDAPNTVKNFIKLAGEHFYDGLIFHRVIKGFMIQGGCPKGDGTGDPGYKIKAEFNARKHVPGTIAMARAQDPDSAGSQFYICLEKSAFLDGKYTVFGQVIEGMDVVKKIGETPTTGNQHTGNFRQPFDKPLEDVVMKKVYINSIKN